MTTVQAPAPSPAAPAQTRTDWLTGRPGLWLVRLALLGCAAGVVAGLGGGPLWLDETLSVEIARLPLPDLFDALRRDGSPPLYYLLLHGWISLVGTGTVAVRLLTVLFVPVALLLVHRLGGRLAGVAGARASVVAFAALPWTMRFGSEARMYLLVAVLALAGTFALMAVRASASRRPVVALGLCVGALLLTHYWALFLLLAVALLHVPGVLRRDGAALRVAAAFVVGAVLFLPWLPTFLFQTAHTGAPWSDPVTVLDLLRTPLQWGGGSTLSRTAFAVVLVPLVVAARRSAPSLPSTSGRRASAVLGTVAGATLLLAWAVTAVAGGAYAGRYTAVVVPLVAVVVALGALALPGPRRPFVALATLLAVGVATGVASAAVPRTPAARIAAELEAAGRPGDVVAYCPDQLAPPVARVLGDGYRHVVYPAFGPPQRIEWVDYAERNAAADPARFAARLDALAGSRQVFVVKAAEYRTFGDDCELLLDELAARRGAPERLFGKPRPTGQKLYGFPGR
jgi:mannosyltransferase